MTHSCPPRRASELRGRDADGVDEADEFAAVAGGFGECDLLAVAIFEFEINGEGVARLWIGIRRRERDPDHQYFAGAKTIGALQRRRGDRNARIGADRKSTRLNSSHSCASRM